MPAPAAKHTYLVTPVNGEPYEVIGTSYLFDETNGRHQIKEGDELIANLINVSVRRK